MAMDGLTPVVDIGGNGNGGWGDWGGALIGGAIGGAVGSAWGDRRGNNCCNNGGCCNGGGNTAAFGETFIMDSLSGARSDINSIGRDNLMQTAGVQNALCQGFGGVNAKIVESVLKVLQNPPATWAAYLKNKDYAGIAKMEAKELMSAIEKHKAPADIHKEITHTIAALMRMGI